MTTDTNLMDKWKDTDWKKIERSVFKLQKRIYQASSRGDIKTVHKLQKLLIRSRAAKLLAVRKITQDNQGKKTAGIDGVKSLTPKQRIELVENLEIKGKASPVRRVWIPKPGTNEKRGLGIPTMYDRALQCLIKIALEPQWEARFEPNSYGFRPARSAHDAVEAIFKVINQRSRWVLDADIAKCFDKIDQKALLNKTNTSPSIRRQIKKWLEAGVLEGEQLFPTQSGVPQGGVISPLLMNIALHGLETMLKQELNLEKPIFLIRYADDIVVLHDELTVIKQCKEAMAEWLKEMGLELKPSKTRIVHTLERTTEGIGFDFLGFNFRHYKVGKTKSARNKAKLLGFKAIIKPSKEAIKRHNQKLKETIRNNRAATQEQLIKTLNPIIRGWSNYYSTVSSKKVFGQMGYKLFIKLIAWGKWRHPKKNFKWIVKKYWIKDEVTSSFQSRNNQTRLKIHSETAIKKYIKVQNKRSPFDGDWVYWSKRLGEYPEVSTKVAYLLKKQNGECLKCGLFFKDGDLLEIDHIIARNLGGNDAYYNWQLLHRHCHDQKTAMDIAQMRCG